MSDRRHHHGSTTTAARSAAAPAPGDDRRDLLEIVPLGAGQEVGRSCIIVKYQLSVGVTGCGVGGCGAVFGPAASVGKGVG
jgi:hypothetical protein